MNMKKNTKSAEIHPDTHFRMLSNLANDPYLTQRALAKKELDISIENKLNNVYIENDFLSKESCYEIYEKELMMKN